MHVGGTSSGVHPASKKEAGYWVGRLFKNTFTNKGKRRLVNGWSVKIQVLGRRKTFTLSSSDPAVAAAEACQIYQIICSQGWEAANPRFVRAGFPQAPATPAPGSQLSTDFGIAPWESRLIHRKYPEPAKAQDRRELSVRIEHMGISRYFPLGTGDESKAAAEAKRIHQIIVSQGWTVAGQGLTRELTLALRWLDSPLAWTYTTIRTWKSGEEIPALADSSPKSTACQVAIVEPDAGIRQALAACGNQQEGFRCCVVWTSVAEAMREISRHRVDLVLINYALPDQSGAAALEELQRGRSGL